jgi:cytochrome oxidase Cu insertion factor (SCO1/SenC/PrrC family)
MSGMYSRSIDLTSFLVVHLFRHALFVTGTLWICALAFLFLVVLIATRTIFRFNIFPEGNNEPRARTYLRWAFGAIWLVDGILQFQGSMPLGLANNVVRPLAAGTPSWLHSLMIHGINIWNAHPISLATGVAWFQVGLGLIILVSRGRTGRWAALVSVVWAAGIWLIGNGAGGIFVRGASILFGWPGATMIYVVAGIWLFVSNERFRDSFSPFVLKFLSLVFLVAIIFQSLPAAGFWHGGDSNALTAMTQSMTSVAQPHPLAWVVREGGVISGRMGGGFNIVVILWLLVTGIGLWLATKTRRNWSVYSAVVGCLILWVVAEDAALYGGLSTDFNSLLPMAVLAWCAMPRLAQAPARNQRLRPELTSGVGAVVATFAAAMMVTSAVSMFVATTVASAENTFFLAQNGSATPLNTVAPRFTLTDQFDKTYSLGEHPGYATLITFLDPVCWTDCPLLASQVAQVRSELSKNAKLDIVAVAADPYHETLANVRHFIAIHHVGNVKNFYFVTGQLAKTSKVWSEYGIGVTMTRTDAMSIHDDYMYIVNAQGRLKWIIPDDPSVSASLKVSSVAQIISLLATQGVH